MTLISGGPFLVLAELCCAGLGGNDVTFRKVQLMSDSELNVLLRGEN